jgi:hypothetical protein
MDRVSDSGAIRSGLVPQLKHRAPHRAFPSFLARRAPCRRDGQPSALPWKMRAVKDGDQRRSRRPRRSRKPTGFCRGMTADRALRPPVCWDTERSVACPGGPSEPTVMQAFRPRQRGTWRSRRGRTTSGSRWAFAGPLGSMYLPRREMTRGSERGWKPLAGPNHAARSVIRDPCEFHCACRSVTESIPS